MKVSVLILTLNEELNIAECIRSVQGLTDDIIVFDSISSDNTVKIASDLGARIVEREFSGWAAHQNWALNNIRFKYDWVLYVDADERVSTDLLYEISNLEPDGFKAFKVFRDNRFISGESLKFSMKCPGIVRLFTVNNIFYQRDINPVAFVDGKVGKLKSKLIHYNFSKGVDEWLFKHIDYAKREALEFRNGQFNQNLPILKRRTANIVRFRFVLRMIYQLVFKLGILDGYAGFRYSVLISFYEQLIEEYMR
ncbi:glycosyltransferase family 2 protein [Roseobacter sp. HKCCD5988]|uniref:glycosyltransferase family 2 protein n=1 Tax=Roseobacter sp. HKCCD5988 TaxID=3120338 RepID=UPI0030EEF7B6